MQFTAQFEKYACEAVLDAHHILTVIHRPTEEKAQFFDMTDALELAIKTDIFWKLDKIADIKERYPGTSSEALMEAFEAGRKL